MEAKLGKASGDKSIGHVALIHKGFMTGSFVTIVARAILSC